MHNYPNLEELYLNNNPISMIFPEAMMQIDTELSNLEDSEDELKDEKLQK